MITPTTLPTITIDQLNQTPVKIALANLSNISIPTNPLIIDATDTVKPEQWSHLNQLLAARKVTVYISPSNHALLKGSAVGQNMLRRGKIIIIPDEFSPPPIAA